MFLQGTHSWLILDMMADCFFLVDIALHFRTSVRREGTIETRWREIAKIYLQSWFLIDVVASLPLSFMISSGDGALDRANKWVRTFLVI
jgi:hypothetical protein